MICWICLVLGIICTVVFIYKREANSSHFALLLKTSSSMMFIMTAIVAVYYNKGDMRYGLLIALGLVFSMLGDIWLDLKWIYPRDIKYYLYGGFVFFMLGHVCYTSAMGLSNGITLKELLICFIAPAIVCAGMQFAAKPLKLDFTGYKFITALYTLFLTLTLSMSILTAIKTGGARSQVMM
ncbi:MAG: lysoplasmalogenase, partial [Clostridia bacterium]|nr:lysoplasmalogenase [Clostridia bacterium]